jgi:hypothetical protein
MRLLNNLDWLNYVLFMVNFHRNIDWHMNWARDDSWDDFLNRVRSGDLYDLLNNLLLILRLLHEDLSWDWDLNDLLDNSFHGVRYIAGDDLFHGHGYAHFLWNLHFVRLGEWPVHSSDDFTRDLIRDWTVDDSFHRVGYANFFRNSNLHRNINLLVDNLCHWIRDRDVNNPFDGVWHPALDNLDHWVWDLDWNLLWNFIRSIDTSLNHSLHRVRHRSVDNSLNFHGYALLNNSFDRLRHRTIHYFLNSVGYANFLADTAFHRGRNWNRTVHRDIDVVGNIHSANVGHGVRAIHLFHNVHWNRNLDWNRHMYCTGNFDDLLNNPFNGDRNALFDKLFNWIRNSLFHKLFHRNWYFDTDGNWHVHIVRCWPVNNSLHRVRNSCLDNSLLHLLNGHIDHFFNKARWGIHILSVSNSWLDGEDSLVHDSCSRIVSGNNWSACNNRAWGNDWPTNMRVNCLSCGMLMASENHD